MKSKFSLVRIRATRRFFIPTILATALAMALAVKPAKAADAYWDTNADTAGAGATPTGTWGTNSIWSSSADGDVATAAWVSGDVAIFSAGTDATSAYTVTLSGTQTIGGLTVQEGTPTISGGTALALNAAATPFAITGTANISSVISGTGFGISKSGAGLLTLTGPNTFTGKTSITGGTISIAADSGLGTAPGAAVADQLTLNGGALRVTANSITLAANRGVTLGASGGTFDFSGRGTGETFTVGGIIAGTGALTLASSGDISATGGGAGGLGIRLNQATNTFTGDVTITSGLVSYANNLSFGNAANKIILNGGGLLDNNANIALARDIEVQAGGGTFRGYGSINVAWSGAITGSGNINRTDGGTLTLSGNLSGYSGTYNNQGGNTTLTGTASTIGGNWTISAATLTVNSTANQALAGTIAGTGAFTKNAAGILSLSGTNTYTGATTITLGTLRAGGAAGGQAFGNGSAITLANAAATLDLNGFSQSIGSLTGGGAGGGNVTLGSNATLTVGSNNSSPAAYAGIISGTGTSGLIKIGTGTLTLSGANTYAGATTISAGTIQADNSSALGIGGSVSVATGAKLVFNANNLTVANNITLNGPTANGALYSGDRPGGNVTNLTGQITLNATSNISTWFNDKTLRLSGKITGSGGLDFVLQPGSVGGRYLISGSTNDYNGATSVTGNSAPLFGYTGQAQLYLGATNALPTTTTLTLNNADLYLNGQSQTLPLISGTGSFSVQNGSTAPASLTLGAGNASSTFSGTIRDNGIIVTNTASTSPTPPVTTGTVSLTKTGTGTLTLTGTNTYSGGTTVSAGTLIGTGPASVSNNSNLTIASSATFAYQPTAAGSLGLGTGVLNLASGSRIGTALGGTLSQSAIVSSAAAVTVAGPVTVDIFGVPGVATAAGTHQLIIASGGLNNATYALGTVYNATNFTVSGLSQSATAVSITTTAATALTEQYWKGGFGGLPAVWSVSNGSTASNWASDLAGTNTPLTPGPTASLIFSATGATNQGAMTLGANMSVGGIVVNDTNPLGLNADGYTLTLGAGGILLNSGAGAVTFGVPITLGATQSWTNDSGSLFTIAGPVANAGFTPSIGGSSNVSLTGTLTGVGGLTKTGAGILTVSGTGTYAGATTINGGTLQVGALGALPTGGSYVLANTAGAALDLNGFNTTVGSIAGGGAAGGSITLGAVNLTTGGNNSNTSFSGVISGTNGSLTKVGTGTLTLDGAASNTFTGMTTLSGTGQLVLAKTGGAKAIGGDINMSASGTRAILSVAQNNQFADGSVMRFTVTPGDTRFELKGTTQTLSGIDSTGFAGVSAFIQHNEFGAAAVVSPLSTLILDVSGAYNYGNAPNVFLRNQGGTVALTKTGVGTQTLTGANIIYTGATTLSAGTLALRDTTGFNSAITLSGSGVLNSERTALGIGSRSPILGPNVSGAGTLNINNSGTGVAGGWTTVSVANGLTMAGTVNVNTGVFARDNTSLNNINTTATFNVAADGVLSPRGGGIIIGALNGAGRVSPLWSGTNATTVTLGNGNGTGSFSGIISGNGTNGTDGTLEGGTLALTKIGSGTQTISGSNTFTGATTVNGGILKLDFAAGGTSNIIAPASALVLGGGTLEIQGGNGETNTQTFNGISGSGNIVITTNGATFVDVTVGAINTASGSLNFVGSDATVSGLGVANFLTTTTTTGNDGTTRLGGHLWNGTKWASTSTAGGNHVVEWVGTYEDLTTDGNNVANPTSDLRIIDGTATGTAATYSANTTANSLLMSAPTYASTIDLGSNTLTLGNGAGATGAVGQASGAQALTVGATPGQGFLTAGTSGDASILALNNQSGSALTVNSVISNNAATGVVSLTTSGNATLNAVNTFTGSTTVTPGTLTIGGAGTLGTGNYAGAIANSGSFVYASSAAQTLTGVISGNGTLAVNGSGTLTLSTATNTYTGPTTVSTGVLNIRSASALGSTAAGTTVSSGAALQIQGVITTAAEPLTLSGTGVATDGALRNISDANTFAGPITLAAATRINSDAGTLTLSGAIGGAGQNLTVGGAGNTTISSVIGTSGGSLTKDGAGTLTLSAVSTYTGGTTVDNGTLSMAGTGGNTRIIGAVTVNSAGTLLTTGDGTGLGYNNQLTSLTINGGLVTAAAASNMHIWNLTGGVTMTGGTLQTNGGVSTLTGNQLEWNRSSVTTLASANTATIAGRINIRTDNSYTTIPFNVAEGAAATDLLVSAGITASGAGITKSGLGLMALTAANTYNGATNISAGTLSLTGANGSILSSSPNITGGTLRIDNTGAANSASRLGDVVALTLNNGTLQFAHDAAAATNFAETTGVMNLTGGANTIETSQAATGQTSTLTLAGLTYTGGSMNFSGTGLGVDNRNRILITSYADGQLMPWATVNGSGVAKYSTTLGVTLAAFTDVPFAGTITDAPSTDIRLFGGTYTGTSTDHVLLGSATTTVGSILQAQTNPTTIDNASQVLRLGAAGSVVMTSGVASLTIGTAANSGTLTAGGADNTAGTINLTNDDGTALLTINSAITNNGSGVVGLATRGIGKVVLAGTNTYTGTTVLSAATTEISGASQTLSGAVSGAGALVVNSSGVLTLSGTNTPYTGAINVNAGTLRLGSATGLGTSPLVTVASGGTLDVNGFAGGRPVNVSGMGAASVGALYNSSTTAGASVASLTLSANASVASAVPGANTATLVGMGTVTLNGNTLNITGGAFSTNIRNITSGNININSGGTLYIDNGGSQTSVTGTITINTGGVIDTRDTDNTAMGTVHTIALNGGQLGRGQIAGNNGGGAGTTLKNNITVDAVNGGSILNSSSGGFGINYRLTGSISGSGPLTLGGAVGVEFQGDASSYTGTATATGGTVTFNPSAANQLFGGNLAGTRPVVKNGANITTFLGNNSYSGATTVSGGTMVLFGNNTASTSAFTLNAGTSLKLDYSTNNNRKIGSGALTLSGASIEMTGGSFEDSVASTTLTASTINTITRTTGTAVLNLGAITVNPVARLNLAQSGIARTSNANNAQGTLGSWATIGGTLPATNDGTGLIVAATTTDLTRLSSGSKVIADAASSNVLFIEGTGTAGNFTLGAATTNINTLTQSSVGGASAASVDMELQTLALNSVTVGTGAGALTIGTALNNGTLRAVGTSLEFRDLAAAGITVNSIIADGTGATLVRKFEPGIMTFSGTNSYTGGTIVDAGTLTANLGNTAGARFPFGSGTITMNAGTTLRMFAASTSNAMSFVNPINLNSATLTSEDAVQTYSGNIALTGANTVNVSYAAKDAIFSGIVSGGGSLTKASAGLLILSNANTYTGGTTVTGGTLRALNTGAFGAVNAAITLNAATISLSSDTAVTAKDLTLAGTTTTNTITLDRGSQTTTWRNLTTTGSNRTLAVNMGSGLLPSSLVFSGTFSPAVTTTVNTFNIGTDATLSLASASLPTGAQNWLLTKSGAGTLITGGAWGNWDNGGANTGVTTLSGGTLELRGAMGDNTDFRSLTASSGTTLRLANDSSTSYFSSVTSGTNDGTLNFEAGRVTSGTTSMTHSLGSLTLAGTGTSTVNVNRASTITGAGVGTVAFTGATTMTGATNFSVGANAELNLQGAVGGNFVLTKNGAGTLSLNGTATYTAATNVSGGTMILSGASGRIATSSGITLSNGSTLTLANTSLANNTDRIAGTFAMNGGTLNFTNNAGAVNYAETTGNLSIGGGANTIATGQAASGQTSTLAFGTLSRTAGAVNFSGTGLGVDARNRITFTGGVTAGQPIGTWATYNGVDFAAYDATNGVVAFTGYTDVTRLSSGTKVIPNTSAANIRIIEGNTAPAANLTLAAATTTINTLNQSTSGGTSAATIDPDLTNTTLAVNSILVSAGAGGLTIGTAAGDGNLRAVTTALQVIENTTGGSTINSTITNGTAASSFTKSGTGLLTLTGTNSYTGVTTIEGGILAVSVMAAGGSNSGIGAAPAAASNLVLNNGTLRYTGNTVSSNRGFTIADASTGTVDVSTSGQTLTISTAIPATSGSFVKSGAGILGLSAANLFTGNTTVSAGTLTFSGSGVLYNAGSNAATVSVATGAQIIASAATNNVLGFASGATWNISGTFNSSGGGAQTMPGTVILNNGTLTGVANGTFGTFLTNASYTINLTANGTTNTISSANFGMGNGTTLAVSTPLAGDALSISSPLGLSGQTGSLIKSGLGTVTLTGASLYTGATRVTAGVLAIGTGGSTSASSTITVSSGATLRFDRNDVWGNHQATTSSPIVLNQGTLATNGNFNTIINPTLNGGTVTLNGGASASYPALAIKGTLTVGGNAASTINVGTGTNNFINIGPSGTAGTLVVNVADATASTATDLTINSVLQNNWNAAGNVQVASVLQKTGAGTLNLAPAGGGNTFTGGLTVSNGLVLLTGSNLGNSVAGAGTLTIDTGATVRAQSHNALGQGTGTLSPLFVNGGTFEGAEYNHISQITMTGGSIVPRSGITPVDGLDLKVYNTLNPSITTNASATQASISLRILNNSAGPLTTTVADGAAAIDLSISGVIAGSQGLVKAGAGTLNLTGANTYGGGTTVNQGTLTVGTGGTLGAVTGALVVSNTNTGAGTNSVLNLATAVNTTTGSLSGTIAVPTSGINTATINTQAGRVFTVNQTTAGTYAGVIAGTGDFVLGASSTNTLTLTGANTYTGTTTVNAGTLALVGGSQASPVTVSTGASLSFAIGSPTTSSSSFDVTAGTIKVTGTPTLDSHTLITSSTGITGTPTLHAAIPGYLLKKYNDNSLRLISLYQEWADVNNVTGAKGADDDGDTYSNLMEYAFGTNPKVASSGSITYSGVAVTATGQPVLLEESGVYYAVFGRRADYVAAGLTYTVQFSAGLDQWTDGVVAPTFIATDGTIDAVRVPFPNFVPTTAGPKKPTFFRVQIAE